MDLERCYLKWHVPAGRGTSDGKWAFFHPDHPDCPITAAFFVPLRTVGGVPHSLVPEEDAIDNIPENRDRRHPDYREAGGKKCTPMVGLFGGKVDRDDRNPVATAIRETREETGRHATGRHLMPHVDEAHVLALVKKNRLFAEYMPNAKALIIFYQVPAEQRDAWDALPQKYKEEFKGTVDAPSGRSAERKRSAPRLHWVPCPGVNVNGFLAGRPRFPVHECVPGPDACAIRCCRQQCAARGKPLLWKGHVRVLECSRRGTSSHMDRVANPPPRARRGRRAPTPPRRRRRCRRRRFVLGPP